MWIDVPFVSQPREGCGAASLSMLMQYWAGKQQLPNSPDSDVALIQHQLYSKTERGIPAEQMGKYLRQHGFKAIVAIRPEGQSELHYVVIDGVDTAKGLITMNDPAVRKLLTEERGQFEKEWSATHNWTLLAVPASSSH